MNRMASRIAGRRIYLLRARRPCAIREFDNTDLQSSGAHTKMPPSSIGAGVEIELSNT